MLGFLALLSLPACGERDCGHVIRPTDRDWCFADEAVDHARVGDMGSAAMSMGRITDDLIRAVAVQRLIGARVPGIDRGSARELCAQLAAPHLEKCLEDWDRPEAWGGDEG